MKIEKLFPQQCAPTVQQRMARTNVNYSFIYIYAGKCIMAFWLILTHFQH